VAKNALQIVLVLLDFATWWLGAYAIVFGFALMAVAIKLYQRRRDQPHG